jgi:hypothetical protein
LTLTWCEGLSMEMPCSLSESSPDTAGYPSARGCARELTLKLSDVRDDWVTELQEPIAPNEAA